MTSLSEMISGFPNVRIVILGDVMLDRFVFGDVRRVSPEAPIPVLRVSREDIMLGGAGNVACNVARMGGRATLISAMGRDAAGEMVEAAAAREERLATAFIRTEECVTTIKTRFVAQGQQLLRVDDETAHGAPAAVAGDLLTALDAALDDADILVLSDYAKGVLTDEIISKALLAARQRQLRVIVDPKGRNLRRYAEATVITPNAHEAEDATGISCNDDAGAARAAKMIADAVGCRAVVVTRGARGMTVLSRLGGEDRVSHLPTVAQAVHDVSGAGDTVIAALALALAVDASLEDAARLANIAAGIVVAKVGTAPVEAAELARSVQVSGLLAENAKIVDLGAAASASKAWRQAGQRVVFTNGCFDLLHPGHVGLLRRARAEGDRLIVAMNSDDSVRRLKGAGRPVQNEMARATVMSSIGVVDLVVIFSEDTPLATIQAIAPDILVKGADYTEDEVVGGDLVRAAGGRIVLVPIEEGHSTTGAIQRAKTAVEPG